MDWLRWSVSVELNIQKRFRITSSRREDLVFSTYTIDNEYPYRVKSAIDLGVILD